MIPGLEQAEFVRFGMVHRNTYINGPTVLLDTWQTRPRADLFFAGQVSGVEGYVESAASGLIAGRNAAALVLRRPLSAPPRTTAIGALALLRVARRPAHAISRRTSRTASWRRSNAAARQDAQEDADRGARACRSRRLAARDVGRRRSHSAAAAHATRAGTPIGPGEQRMRAPPRGVSRVPSLQPQRFDAHRPRVRVRHHAVSRAGSPPRPAAASAISRPATSIRRRCARTSPSLTSPGRSAELGGAQDVGAAHLRPLSAARRRARTAIRRRWPWRRGASTRCRSHLTENEMTRLLEMPDAAIRSAVATARSSSCSTPRACA